jgi:dihydrolipoamide dehydrogenase
MTRDAYDLIVIGGGPGGYVAAIRATQLGMSVACIDENAQLGGTCLRVGCIPSKALLESSRHYDQARHGFAPHGVLVGDVRLDLIAMHQRKSQIVKKLAGGIDGLFKQARVTRLQGRGRLTEPGRVLVVGLDGERSLAAKHVLIATGSRPAPLAGVALDGDRIGTSTEALAYSEVPKQLVVIGAGYIGLELGSVWSRLGAKVTVLEALDRILPGMDLDLARNAQQLFEKQGISFQLGARVENATVAKGKCMVRCSGAETLACSRVLVAVGRRANTEDLGLETVGISPDERGEIPVGDNFATSAPGVYAVGDCIRGPKLAHKASHEALACIDALAGRHAQVNYDTIPGVVYTHPEIASVGRTEQQLQEEGREYRSGVFLLQASGRARTLGETDGSVKILADAHTDRILGVHVLGPHAGDMIAEATAAMEFGASAEDLAHVCHAHPTLAESLGEAALAVHRRAIHLPAVR